MGCAGPPGCLEASSGKASLIRDLGEGRSLGIAWTVAPRHQESLRGPLPPLLLPFEPPRLWHFPHGPSELCLVVLPAPTWPIRAHCKPEAPPSSAAHLHCGNKHLFKGREAEEPNVF